MRRHSLLLGLAIAASCFGTVDLTAQDVVLDVPAIAGKSQEEVAAILGSPSARETTQHGGKSLPMILYRNGDVEIVYVNGKADWITLYTRLPMQQSSLKRLNLPVGEPTWARQSVVMRWENNRIAGVRAVYIFPDYVYINVLTSP
jgi:hypothetical protein